LKKDIFALVLDNRIDDVAGALGDRRLKQIEDFGLSLYSAIEKSAKFVEQIVSESKSKGIGKREFVEEIETLSSLETFKSFITQTQRLIFQSFRRRRSISQCQRLRKKPLQQ